MKTISFPALMVATAPLTQSVNIQKAQSIFTKFKQGDLPGILEICSDDCVFQHGGDPSLIPFAKPFYGKNGVAEFFQTIAQSINASNVSPSNFRVNGNEVSHDLHVEATVVATGKSYAVDLIYTWVFDENGLICGHSSTGDFSAAHAAFQQ